MLQDDNNFLNTSVINNMINKVFLIQIPRDHANGYSNRFITFTVYMRHLKSVGNKFTNFLFIL